MMFSVYHTSVIYYHDIFSFPLTKEELVKWKCITGITPFHRGFEGLASKKGYYFLKGRENIIKQRLQNGKTSMEKMKIAKRAAEILSRISTVKMIAVTGSLAMMNSSEESDIDLMIITKNGTLWITRLISYLVTWLIGFKTRKPGDKNQKDKLCLNVWLDESDLVWHKKDRNIYTAHEIAQIVPLVNKNETYEKFLYQNEWILNYWSNSVRISEERKTKSEKLFHFSLLAFTFSVVEKFAFWLQYQHMKSKITRETVTRTRALFHPHDWGKVVLKRLSS